MSLIAPSSLDVIIQEIIEKWIQLDVVLLQIRVKLVQAKDLFQEGRRRFTAQWAKHLSGLRLRGTPNH